MDGKHLTVDAPAKINLYLRITGRRPDGCHTILSLMQKLRLFDHLELRQVGEGIRLTCPGSDLAEDENNLVFRAARLFFASMGDRLTTEAPGVELTLHKTIPVAAGLGGGSSDAAATLLGLDHLFATGCTSDELAGMALHLGADVPFFTSDLPAARATGIGEILEPAAPLQGYLVLLVNPGFSVSTKWVYETFALTLAGKKNSLSDLQNDGDRTALTDSRGRYAVLPSEMINDLEQVTVLHYDEIDQIKRTLMTAGAEVAMMSGSGPTVFGLFGQEDGDRARACCRELQGRYRQTFLVSPLMSRLAVHVG